MPSKKNWSRRRFLRSLTPSLFFLLGYLDGVVEVKADPTATILQLMFFTVVFFVLWDAIEFLEH